MCQVIAEHVDCLFPSPCEAAPGYPCYRACRLLVPEPLCSSHSLSILQINDFLISKDELSHRIALVGATTSMLAGGLVILGFMYHYYAPYANCGLNIFFITWTLIMALIYVALSVRMLLSISLLPD